MDYKFVLFLAITVCSSHASAPDSLKEVNRRKYIVKSVGESGVRCRRSLDVSFNGRQITKSFQFVHESLKEYVDCCDKVASFSEPNKISGPHTHEVIVKQQKRGQEVRKVRNTNKFFHPMSADCNFAVATLGFILRDGTVIGGDTLISNGFQATDFVDDSSVQEIATKVFSSSMFREESIDREILALLFGRDLVGEETYTDTELQIVNRLFEKKR